MTIYQVELKRTSYVTITVEAENQEAAEAAAWRDIEHGRGDINDAQWDISNIEQQEAAK